MFDRPWVLEIYYDGHAARSDERFHSCREVLERARALTAEFSTLGLGVRGPAGATDEERRACEAIGYAMFD